MLISGISVPGISQGGFMFRALSRAHLAVGALALFASTLVAVPSIASPVYTLTPLVTDDQNALANEGFGPAVSVDPNLINPWGISLGPTSPFWVSNQGSDSSTLYDGEGTLFPPGNPLLVAIPHAGPPSGPTGQVFAGGSGLALPNGNDGLFYFANLDGSISGWNLDAGTTAVVVVPPSADRPAVYTGLALGSVNGGSVLYAANNLTGHIDVFDANYQPVDLGSGAFAAGDNPDGLAPFNVQNIGGLIYVTFATPGVDADEAPLGSGFVNIYNPDGTFVRRIDSDQFASPWGMTIASDAFGDFSGALLVGNFNDEFGYINAFEPVLTT